MQMGSDLGTFYPFLLYALMMFFVDAKKVVENMGKAVE